MAKGEVEVTEVYEAAYFQYNGALCIKCISNGRADDSTTWFFRVPAFDAEIMREEFVDEKTSLYLQGFINAFRAVTSFRKKAQLNLGVWTSHLYANAVSTSGVVRYAEDGSKL